MGSRIIVRMELTQQAKNRLDDYTAAVGMTQVAALSRLVEWFADQPESIQSAVLGRYPKFLQGDIATLILQRMENTSHPSRVSDRTTYP